MSGSTPRDTVREALTGPHSISLTGWLATLVPAALLVMVQEASTPFPVFAWVLLSAALQHAGDGVLAFLAFTAQRHAPRLDRMVVRAVLWTAIGMSRGFIGGTLAATFAGVEPLYEYRIAFWVLVTWTWMPAIGYSIAQLEIRRDLLGIRDAERADLENELARNAEHRDTLRSALLGAVQASVGPAVDEIRARLLRMGTTIDATSVRQIGEKIAGIVDDAAAIVRGRPTNSGAEVPVRPPRASVWAAVEFDQRRPLLAAAVMAVGMSTLLVPDALRVAGPIGAASVGLGIMASIGGVLLAALLERVIKPRSPAAQIGALAFRVLAAGLAGSTTILLFGGGDRGELLLAAVLLPIVAGVAAAIVPALVGTLQANETVRNDIEALRTAHQRSEVDAELDESLVRAQVAELLHGPIQGRLSACAMALGFHAAEEPPPDVTRTTLMTTAVLDHLNAVSKDLEALAAPPWGGGGSTASH